MKKVLIHWEDACGGDGWTTLEELKERKPIEHETIGYVAHETKKFITITMSIDKTENEYGAWLLIPKSYIKRKKELK